LGLVFDIQRGCLHDGPGIRTTVFLKGCPLRCAWCHNPEAMSASPQLFFTEDKCVSCGKCAAVCHQRVHRLQNSEHSVEFTKCLQCGACVDACDHEGLRIVGKEMSADEVMKEVLADADFYLRSGGGITLSGGEPLFQPRFVRELLARSKESGIHTCVETSGFVAESTLREILPLIELVLFDYKVSDHKLHRELTGVTDDPILQNLDMAYRMKAPIVLRCPLIPGINDGDDHLRGIANLSARYPALVGVEVIPYHGMGLNKARSIGMTQLSPASRTVNQSTKERWMVRLQELGCMRAALG